MKILIKKTLLAIYRYSHAACALLWLSWPTNLAAQPQRNFDFSNNIQSNRHQQRLQNRMGAETKPIDSLSDKMEYLAASDDAFMYLASEASLIDDFDLFDNRNGNRHDFEEPNEPSQYFSPMPALEFNFMAPDKLFEENDEELHFFRENHNPGAICLFINQAGDKDTSTVKKIRKMVILHGHHDTIQLEGDSSLIYTISDNDGFVTIENNGLPCDTPRSHRSHFRFSTFNNSDREKRHEHPAERHAVRREFRHEMTSGNDRFISDHFNLNRLSDLTSADIDRLKHSDLKPTRKTAPLGIDNIQVSPRHRQNQFQLSFDAPGEGEMTIQLFDASGSLIYDENLRKSSGQYNNLITLPNNFETAFFLRITRQKQSIIKKINL